jgi:CBS domain containing-hemolysin-like protein
LEDDSDHRLLNFFKSLLRKKPHLEKGADLTEEIHDLMNEGQAMGLITNEISDMVYGVLDLKKTKAHSIMIPRTEISSASIDSTLGDAIELVSSCGHTRIPIFKENIDEIAGILHAKDLLKLWGQDPLSKIPDTLLRKPYFVPRNKKISELLKDLRREKTHLAIVTDEYGGTAGIITIEDILEEIVGEIMDEHDDEAVLMTPLDDNTVLVDARLDEEKLEEHFGIKLPEGEYESVGGFVIHLLGEIPKVGQKILFQDLEMTVKSADLRKIDKILIRRVPPSVPTEEAQY